jgi:TRAP-type uncharacterized transport system fused permease subunit
VQVALLVPALVKLGVQPEAAHLFVFYFAILSAITPPVAMAVYAANALAGASIWNSSIRAVKLGIAGFIIPFMFVYEPAILLQGDPFHVTIALAQSILGVVMLAAALHKYLTAPLRPWQQGLLLAAAIGLIYPSWLASIPGLACLALVLFTSTGRHAINAPQH